MTVASAMDSNSKGRVTLVTMSVVILSPDIVGWQRRPTADISKKQTIRPYIMSWCNVIITFIRR